MFKQKIAKKKIGDEKYFKIACTDFGLGSLRAVEHTCTFW